MRFLGYLTIAVMLIFITMHIYYSESISPREPLDLLSNLTIHDELFNITKNTIPYTNLYKEEPNLRNIILNLVHGVFYGFLVEINTLLPISIYIASGKYSNLLFKLVIVYICFYFLFLIPLIIKALIALYFFIREKRKDKVKWYH